MKQQFIAQYQHAHSPGEWRTATKGVGRRYFDTQEEAQAELQRVKEYFNGKPGTTTQVCGMISITSHTDSKAAQLLKVVKTRIRVRLVTEWEVVEEVSI